MRSGTETVIDLAPNFILVMLFFLQSPWSFTLLAVVVKDNSYVAAGEACYAVQFHSPRLDLHCS
jgi:hypothetical protein